MGRCRKGTGAERDNGVECRGRCRGPGQSAITVHGDGVRVKGTGAERDNGARGRCTGGKVQEGEGLCAITVHGEGARVDGKGRGTEQRAIMGRGVRGGAGRGRAERDNGARDGARVHGKVQGTGAERDNGARHGCTGRCRKVKGTRAERDNGAPAGTGRCRGPGQSTITVHGDGARVHRKVQATGARGRCTGAREGAEDRGRAGAWGRCTGAREGAGRDRGRAR